MFLGGVMDLRRTPLGAALLVLLLVCAFVLAPGVASALDIHPLLSIERVSVSATGTQADAGGLWPALSTDGRFVAFLSPATNLVPGDTNGASDVFVKDREGGGIARASVSDGGGQASGGSGVASLSGNGRYIVFDSIAANLVLGDTNGMNDVFLHDRQSGKTVRVSVSSTEAQANDKCFASSVDTGTRYVAFESSATNLVDDDTNGRWDIFVRDLAAGTTERVSLSSTGMQSDGDSLIPSISPDGRYVAFGSRAANLVPGDTNGAFDIFVHDRVSGKTERVSVATGGGQADGASGGASLTAGGRYVVFWSSATNLVAGDLGGRQDVFVRDRLAGTTHRVSVSTLGTPGDEESEGSALSADGRYVAFDSMAGNLVPGDPNTFADVFVRDLRSGKVERLSASTLGGEPDAWSRRPALSADGRYVAFDSLASTLVDADTNGAPDVFVVDRGPGSFPTPFVDTGGSPYASAIDALSGAGIVNGYPTDSGWQFRPQNPLYRAQFAKMMAGAWGLIVDEYLPIAFGDLGPDVPDDLYPHEHVAVAAQHGMTQGITATTFGPYRNLTRAQLLTMVVRSLQKLSPGLLRTPIAPWHGTLPTGDSTHGSNIELAEYNGLLDGIDLTGWDVWQDARRGETARVLANMRDMVSDD